VRPAKFNTCNFARPTVFEEKYAIPYESCVASKSELSICDCLVKTSLKKLCQFIVVRWISLIAGFFIMDENSIVVVLANITY